MNLDAAERVLSKIERRADDECWPWKAGFNGNGYGRVFIEGQMFYAHRVSYELHVGQIPADMVIDHLCKNRACTNPRHLEVVTGAENTRRGLTKEMCLRGHPLAEAPIVQGKRRCAECGRIRHHLAYAESRLPDIEITGHAIDRASLYCRHFWHEDRKKTGAGIHAWLVRIAKEAHDKGERTDGGKVLYSGMKFAFSDDTKWPVLMTIRPAHGKTLDTHK